MEGKPATASKTTVEALREQLAQLNLNTGGNKSELKQRLRKTKKKLQAQADKAKPIDPPSDPQDPIETSPMNRSSHPTIRPQPHDYYLFFDVEATCEADGSFNFPNEIIEFPVVLVDGKTFEIETVDASPSFVEVLNDFQKFMAKYSLFQDKTAAFVTDGPFDIRDFITKQCAHSRIKKRPAYFSVPWVNIRRLFKDFYGYCDTKNISGMLDALDLKFDGREHSGLDDARNLVFIAQRMRNEGCVFKCNIAWDERTRRAHARRQQRRY
ncbi:ribonuclease H-like domain-containing protein [Radiomyces spectabilis]|uniref:ribonuclease H-like domain-containing protein n=1 Tax=Radiomyces spectabilis TaxID=64574 RepID=UPI0022203317|nr:ribonuclease H-like domain-containing protein [Radiomyces spectabilis]KAI8381529.1 ribonuclease H-like domain-containing protein [Radiomyces spectabilis]